MLHNSIMMGIPLDFFVKRISVSAWLQFPMRCFAVITACSSYSQTTGTPPRVALLFLCQAFKFHPHPILLGSKTRNSPFPWIQVPVQSSGSNAQGTNSLRSKIYDEHDYKGQRKIWFVSSDYNLVTSWFNLAGVGLFQVQQFQSKGPVLHFKINHWKYEVCMLLVSSNTKSAA